jgi:hypothetical protein
LLTLTSTIYYQLIIQQGLGMVTYRFNKRYREAIKMAFPELDFDEEWVSGGVRLRSARSKQ